jgi:hypothetical protein
LAWRLSKVSRSETDALPARNESIVNQPQASMAHAMSDASRLTQSSPTRTFARVEADLKAVGLRRAVSQAI